MSPMLHTNDFTVNLHNLLEETFETHHGIYLDEGTSLLDTLKVVSAYHLGEIRQALCILKR
mgnify:CR=1 FL=1